MNVLTGKKGWHKRVNRSTKAVERAVELTDEVTLDAQAPAKIFAAAKASVIKKPTVATTITLLQPALVAASIIESTTLLITHLCWVVCGYMGMCFAVEIEIRQTQID